MAKNNILLGINNRRVMYTQPHSSCDGMGTEGSIYKNNFLLGIEWKIQIYAKKSCWPNPTSHGGGDQGQFTKTFCATNSMKCLELHRNLMFGNHHTMWKDIWPYH